MKKLIMTIAIATMLSVPAMAQVFMDDEDLNQNRGEMTDKEFGVMVPRTGVTYDQWKYAPVGEGILLLAGLAGAYLIGKRRKEE